ncbi:hypothetical protein EST38_g4214 [Candolleomyces aberdarensis]|uniref:Uncharacterized protein n=1 Tax=Candolleomyces aberdarensis TaxID=2316362 RepID=A0A4Q2DQF6_9AGAR|nr:hypothetical protein EST38_g4214 [Candolleomyces aberdarensis]
MLRTVTLVALAAYVSAQSLSSGCTSALSSIALNPAASSCLNPLALVSIATGNSSQSIVPAVDNWLTGVCGAPACSNETIAQVVTNITTGCSTELSVTGADDAGAITTLVQQYYPTVRKVLCLKDGSNNCITQSLREIEGVVGTLSLSNIVRLVTDPPRELLVSNITCTNCVKGVYNIVTQDIPEAAASLKTGLDEQCGATFTDGTTPSGITQSASQTAATTGNSNNNSGALSSFSMAGISVSGLAVVSAVFTLLA